MLLLQVLEKDWPRDKLIAQVYIAVPGLAGSPHMDPKPVPYQFTSEATFHVALPGQQSPPGSPGWVPCEVVNDCHLFASVWPPEPSLSLAWLSVVMPVISMAELVTQSVLLFASFAEDQPAPLLHLCRLLTLPA